MKPARGAGVDLISVRKPFGLRGPPKGGATVARHNGREAPSRNGRLGKQKVLRRQRNDFFGLLTCDAREIVEKGLQGVSSSEMVEQATNRNSRAAEDPDSPQSGRVRFRELGEPSEDRGARNGFELSSHTAT